MASYKRKSFADSDVLLFLSLSEKFNDDAKTAREDEIKAQESEEENEIPVEAKLESAEVKMGRKRGHYKSFDELGLKQRKRRTDELFLSLKRTATENQVSPLIISAEQAGAELCQAQFKLD